MSSYVSISQNGQLVNGKPRPRFKSAKQLASGNPAQKPKTIPVNVDAIPEALIVAGRQWCVWQWRWSSKSEAWGKLPCDPTTGKPGEWKEKPATVWRDFDEAAGHYRAHPDRYDGIGLLLDHSGLVCIDLDSTYDADTGEVTHNASEVVKALNSYAEVSPSGTGIKVFGLGMKPRGFKNKAGSFEVYDSNFVTVTGGRVRSSPKAVAHVQSALDQLAQPLNAKTPTTNAMTIMPDPNIGFQGTDEELVRRAMSAKNGVKFTELWHGRWDQFPEYPSSSEADLALVGMIAFWTGPDAERIERIFDLSPMAESEKWSERADYRAMTIQRALAGRTDYYKPTVAKDEDDRATLRVFSNTVIEEEEVAGGEVVPRKRGLSAMTLAQRLFDSTGQWPRKVGDVLFAIVGDGTPLLLKDANKLFAWIDGQFGDGKNSGVCWTDRGTDVVSKGVFLEAVANHAQAYDTIESVRC